MKIGSDLLKALLKEAQDYVDKGELDLAVRAVDNFRDHALAVRDSALR